MSEEKTGTRINKALARAGLCSRRQAEDFIRAGRVRLNGEIVADLGRRVTDGDELSLDGKSVSLGGPSPDGLVYLMLNKPAQVVSTARDPEGRPTVLDYLPPEYAGRRVFPVGRLDFFSEGLILLTNDGDLTLRLTHPSFHLPKRYEALVREDVSGAALAAMRGGMTLAEGEKLAPVLVERAGKSARGTLLRLTLHQGVNRQIRRMCRDLGLTLLRLARTGQGDLELGKLKPGQCRPLTKAEIAGLKRSAGLAG